MYSVGERIADRYQVEAQIGIGGIAAVYRVRHVQLGSEHAMKVLLFQRKGLDERLLLEGRIQAQIRHPNVVTVTDVVQHQGRLALLMEYVEGQSLQQWLEEHRYMSLEQALPLFAQVLSGVGTAHAAGVLHRDIKPGNVLLGRTPRGIVPKITDFGLAKVVLDGAPPGSTRDGSMMGTPGYMAPEHIRNAADVDLRADIFALAALLYDLITGRPPFLGEPQEAIDATLAGTYPPLDSLLPGVSPTLVAAIHRALATEREQRFESCAAFAEAIFADRPDLLLISGSEIARPLQLTGQPPPSGGAPPRTSRTGLAGGLLVLATMAVMLKQLLPSQPPAPTNPVVQTTNGSGAPVEEEPAAVERPIAGTKNPGAPNVVAPGEAAPKDPPTAMPLRPLLPATGIPLEATPEPTPEAAPEVVAEPAPEVVATPAEPEVPAVADLGPVTPPEPQAPPVAGTWNGTANGRPATLRILSQNGRSLKAEMKFQLGATERVSALSGSIDPESGAIRLEERGGDELVLTGKLDGNRLAGTFMRMGQSKALAWEVSR